MAEFTVATIGVYGASLETFLAALADADVGLVLDVRQRRGVRGREYAWANSLRLQAALADASIGYRHHRELAADQGAAPAAVPRGRPARRGQAQPHRARARVPPRYVQEILDGVDMDAFAASLPREHASALLCVERDAQACHRSLIAARLLARQRARIVDLVA